VSARRPPVRHVLAIAAVAALLAGGAVLAWRLGGSPVEVRAGVGLVTVSKARAGDTIVVEQGGEPVGEDTADEAGRAVVVGLAPGRATVLQQRRGQTIVTRHVEVAGTSDRGEVPVPRLAPGLNYIPMRDGTLLSAFVTLPGPASAGPYPTVVELSAYRIGDPGDHDAAPGGIGNETAGTQPATAAARSLGYATVGVNVRGTGCSGGVLDLFGAAQAADGYDVVEAVAAQPWVAGDGVGLVGFSYGGLAALQAAATRPPSLRGVAALSVWGDAWQSFHPGGLDNAGFPVGWLRDLRADAQPPRADRIRERIEGGGGPRAANQGPPRPPADHAERLLGPDVPDDGRFDALSLDSWAPAISAPGLVSGQFQDETLGADLATHVGAFTSSPSTRVVLTNGTHADGVAPQVIERFAAFLDLFVADRAPRPFDPVGLLRAIRPDLDADLVPVAVGLDPDLTEVPDAATGRQRWTDRPPIELLWASGTGRPAGAAAATASTGLDRWPPPDTRARAWYLAPAGDLSAAPTDGGPAASIRTRSARADLAWSGEGSDLVTNAFVDLDPPTASATARWTSAPLDRPLVLAGTASLDLWVRTTAADVDLQAVLYVVDEQGRETQVQNGWLRAGYRRSTPATTELRPAVDFSPGARADLPPNRWTAVRIEIPSFAQVVPAGFRLRLQVGTPGDHQVHWSFGPQPDGDATVRIGQAGAQASRLVLPVTDLAVTVPDAACGTLRGQPCRPSPPHRNTEVTP